VTADGASTTTLTFLARDVNNNLVGSLAVSFAASGSANIFGSTSGTTNSMGVLTTSLASSLAQNETIVASYGSSQNSNAIVHFVPGPISTATSSLILSPNSQVANNSNSILATLTIWDAQANPISGASVSFQSTAAAVPSPTSATTNSSGNAYTSYKSSIAQNQNAIAVLGALQIVAPMNFIAGPVSSAYSNLTASPNIAVADTNSIILLQVHLADNNNNVIANQPVAFFSAGGASDFLALAPTTNTAGNALNTIRSRLAGGNRLFAEAQNVIFTTKVSFTPQAAFCTTSPAYSASATLTTASNPAGIVQADFNYDGNLDIALANYNSGSVRTYSGSGNGSFSGPSVKNINGSAPQTMITCDINADGIVDFVVMNHSSASVNTFLGTGTGSFMGPYAWTVHGAGYGLVHSDFNGDGERDIATTSQDASTINILLGTGGGSLSAKVAYPVGSGVSGLTEGDFNADGFQDLAAVNFGTSTVSVLLGAGNGTFAPQITYPTGTGPRHVVRGDFNEDAVQDLAVINATNNTVGILLGTGTVSFASQVAYAVQGSPLGVVVNDFNGDGHADLAVANNGATTISMLLGAGTGSFSSQVTYQVQNNPFSIAVGDFNKDGKQDLAVTNYGSNTASILLYSGCN
jgi:hypothetical protein